MGICDALDSLLIIHSSVSSLLILQDADKWLFLDEFARSCKMLTNCASEIHIATLRHCGEKNSILFPKLQYNLELD